MALIILTVAKGAMTVVVVAVVVLLPLLLPLKNARERGVQASIIESADRLVQAVDAETALAEIMDGINELGYEVVRKRQ